PSGVVASGADGVGRPARPGAIGVSGGRQHRHVVRSITGRLPGAAAWAEEHRVVRPAGPRGDSCPVEDRWMASSVAGARADRSTGVRVTTAGAGVRAPRRLVAGDSRGAHLLEVLLSGEPQQLLHVLSDREVS